MKSKIYSSRYVKTTSKGRIWIPAFLSIGFLMAFPVAELLMMGNWFGMGYSREQIGILYENLWRDGFMTTGYVVGVLAAIINGVNQFWYLYSKRKVDYYHCLPIKRGRMFLHRTYVGLLYYLVPYLVMEFLAVCIGSLRGFFSLHLMKLAFYMMLIHLVLYLLNYFGTVLAVCLTGNMLMGALSLAGLNLYGWALALVLRGYGSSFYATYPDVPYGIIEILEKYAGPIQLGTTFLEKYTLGKGGLTLLLIVITAGFLAAAGYFAYVKRPSESTGKALVYSWSRLVIKILVVIPTGLAVGYIFYILPVRTASRLIWWIFGMAVGTVMVHGIMEVLYQLDFRRFFSHKLQLLLLAAGVAVCAAVFRFDLLGYDGYLPDYESIQTVYAEISAPGHEQFEYITEENGFYVFNDFPVKSKIKGLDIGISKEIYQCMERLAENAENTKSFGGYRGGSVHNWRKDGIFYKMNVQYVRKNGRSVCRSYDVDSRELKKLLLACYENELYKKEKYSSLEIDTRYLYDINATFSNGAVCSMFPGEKKKQEELIEALKADVREASPEVLVGIPCAVLSLNYESVPLKQSVNNMVPQDDVGSYVYSYLYVYPEFKRTAAILKETGYPLSVEEIPVESVGINYYIGEDGAEHSETVIYDSKEEIAALKKGMIDGTLFPTWEERYTKGYLSVKMEGGLESEGGWEIRADLVPAFVVENEKKAEAAAE